MHEIPSEPFRVWLGQAWTRAKVWVDTRDVPTAVLLQRLRPQFDEYRKKAAEAAKVRNAEAQKKAAEVAAYQQKLKDARITPEGLVEMVDASDRFDPAPLAAKLAEIDCRGPAPAGVRDERPEPAAGQGKEGARCRSPDYAIERDEGLVADLKLFAQAP